MTINPEMLSWLAFGIGGIGSVIWAHNGAWSKYACLFWLVSSVLWIWFARISGLPGLAARDVVSILTTLWGTWRWLGVERRRGSDRRKKTSAEVAADRCQPAK